MPTLLIILHIFFVSFTDKPEKTVPALSPRAVEQRAKWHIPTDGMDYPVSSMYLNQVREAGAKVHHVSRWFNGATCEMDSATAVKVSRLSFVTSVEMTRDNSDPIYGPKKRRILGADLFVERTQTALLTDAQLATYNLHPLHEAGFEGQGILMAVCDGGFYAADTMSCFRQKELEMGHFDFTDDRDDFYGSTGLHGAECLSTISALTDEYYGSAPKAQYYLMRAEEVVTESPKEMDNLVAALEKADSLGVNIFSVSLGYALFDNAEWSIPTSALDGKTARCSRAATIAARKGMLVCVAAGNEGNDASWRTMFAPADADSILTVGAVNTDSLIAGFSSWGPSADGRIKPEVCAVGWQTTLVLPDGRIVNGNGTSFATPLLAGLAACLWSALPDENAMQIRERIIRSADRYTTPDSIQYGYGIPDAWKAYTMKLMGIEEIQGEDVRCTKVLRGGMIMIRRGNKTYTITGQRMK